MTIMIFDPEPVSPFHDVSVLHRLVVNEDPEDGLDIEHPLGCVAETGEWDNGLAYVSYDCAVAWHIDGVGLDYEYRHAFDESEPTSWSRHAEPLLPGVYTCWVETVKYHCWDCLGGYEYDSTLWVEPQKALTARPNLLEGSAVWITQLDADGNPTGERHPLGYTWPEQSDREFRQEREGRLRTHWYLTVCLDCGPPFLPQPFRDETKRDEWAAAHATTGHRIELREEWA
jgi:hypothetical protein